MKKWHPLSSSLFCLIYSVSTLAQNDTVESDRILFASEQSGGTLALHSMLADGSDVQLHVPAVVRRRGEYEASVSPDGKHIAFTTYRYSGWKIAISDIDGKNTRRLTMDPQYAYDPAWSPDGKTIVYRRIVNGNGPYFRGNAAIFSIDIDGGNNRRLNPSESECIRNTAFSPDGQHILYDAYINDSIAVMLVDKDGHERTKITDTETYAFAPSWSPDGQWIAHMRQDSDGYTDVWTMRRDGSDEKNITLSKKNGFHSIGDTYDHWQYETSVSPDGMHIAFTADYQDKGNADIYSVSVSTGKIVRLTHGKGADLHPFWYNVSK